MLTLVGSLLILIGVGYAGTIAYFSWREQVSPSTKRVLVLKDGQHVALVQPTSAPQPVGRVIPVGGSSRAAQATATAPQLPPLRIKIPKLDLDWPVVLSDNDHMPQFRGVGWLIGSGFPGFSGNMVLFGHLGGQYGTFMRLAELQPGDIVNVVTSKGEQQYRVRSRYETTPDDVAVLAPTTTASATLITCSGPWDAAAQTNVRRLIVLADYLEE